MENSTNRTGRVSIVFLAVVAVAVLALYNSIYVVDETEQVVITQFGRIVGEAKKNTWIEA